MENIICHQRYAAYTEEDHSVWSLMSGKQMQYNFLVASREYQYGCSKLSFDRHRIIKIDELNEKLGPITGWQLVPVAGLIPAADFFQLLIVKKYPITVNMRKREEMDFSVQPDIFHDIYGHVPLLANDKFCRFLKEFATLASAYAGHELIVEKLARLYWYTYEMGIILEQGEMRPYGGALITSRSEIANMRDPAVTKYNFDIDRILDTPYNSFKLQNEYFIITSFDDLFDSIPEVREHIVRYCIPEEQTDPNLLLTGD